MLPKVSNIIPKVTKYYHKFPNFGTICIPINPYILSSVRYVCRFYRPWLDVAHLQWFWSKWYGFCICIVFVVSLLSTCIDIAYLVYLWFMSGKNEWCSGKPKAVRVRLNNNDSEVAKQPRRITFDMGIDILKAKKSKLSAESRGRGGTKCECCYPKWILMAFQYIYKNIYKNWDKIIFEFGDRLNPPHWPPKFENPYYRTKKKLL